MEVGPLTLAYAMAEPRDKQEGLSVGDVTPARQGFQGAVCAGGGGGRRGGGRGRICYRRCRREAGEERPLISRTLRAVTQTGTKFALVKITRCKAGVYPLVQVGGSEEGRDNKSPHLLRGLCVHNPTLAQSLLLCGM